MFRTTSLPGAAFIHAHGFQFKLEPVDGRFAFAFPDPNGQAATLLQDYQNNADTPSRQYYSALQSLRFAINRASGKTGGVR